MISIEPIALQGYGVLLEPLSLAHADMLSQAATDGELWNLFVTFVPHPNDVSDYIQSALDGQSSGHMLPWAVTDAASGKVIGATRFHDIRHSADRVEIGYTWYSERFHRTHVNTACKLLLLEFAFERLVVGSSVFVRTS